MSSGTAAGGGVTFLGTRAGVKKVTPITSARNINESDSDILTHIRFPFESSFSISVSGWKLTILPDIQPANRIVIISGALDWAGSGL